mmetsp:Transcript_27203/g.73091  ORF Transcript_27203/g.73091 Transcript_27203/m.73091 type:complete len:193 (-) Transcript_27203:652-1230(-)
MTSEELRELRAAIGRVEKRDSARFTQIVRMLADAGVLSDEGEVELDALPTDTLWALHALVQTSEAHVRARAPKAKPKPSARPRVKTIVSAPTPPPPPPPPTMPECFPFPDFDGAEDVPVTPARPGGLAALPLTAAAVDDVARSAALGGGLVGAGGSAGGGVGLLPGLGCKDDDDNESISDSGSELQSLATDA